MTGLPPVGRRAVATAPVRVADVGGWTDTWFAARGAVCSVAVGPGVSAEVRVRPGRAGAAVRVWAPDVGVAFTMRPDDRAGAARPEGSGHPLLHHAVVAGLEDLPTSVWGPTGISLDVTVGAAVPPGSAVGTSASVLVALLAALDAIRGRAPDPGTLARRAFQVETVGVGRESGVQDHVAAAYGGVSWIEVDPFPSWRQREIPVAGTTVEALRSRLVTVHLGGGHDSSVLHRVVIERLEAGDEDGLAVLAELRGLAELACDRLRAGDLTGWAATLSAATQEQARLHPALVGDDARAVLDLAAAHGSLGGKVNGAGGSGGTVTVLGPEDPGAVGGLRDAVATAGKGWEVLDLVPADGVDVVVEDP